MNTKALGALIKKETKNHSGVEGNWTFEQDGVRMTLVTDSNADRMRIVAPILDVDKLDRKDLLTLLEANFDRALDAKYTVYNGAVWSAYVHPLSPLTRAEFVSASKQVAALVNTYGTSYSSTGLVFGGGAP